MAVTNLSANSLLYSPGVKAVSLPDNSPPAWPYSTSFETSEGGTDGWAFEVPATASSRSTSFARTGVSSLSLTVPATSTPGGYAWRQFAATPGRTYTISVWARFSGGAGGGTTARIAIRNGTGSASGGIVNTSWTQLSGTFVPSKPVVWLGLGGFQTSVLRTFFFDDLVIS